MIIIENLIIAFLNNRVSPRLVEEETFAKPKNSEIIFLQILSKYFREKKWHVLQC